MLSNIALALSGGGYRAACFHLGVLSCLHKAGLLHKVTMISSVSGGTITATKYSASLASKKNKAFSSFETELTSFLLNRNLVDGALQLLGEKRVDKENYTLITACAELYDKYLFKKNERTFGCFENEVFKTAHLKEVCFNATDFYTGNSFRFLKSQSKQAVIGNGDIKIPIEQAEKIRLGDIVAASSCFPGGFEPIDLVKDFIWEKGLPKLNYKEDHKEPVKVSSLPLMDGGIYDNQGMEAIKQASDRVKKEDDFDLIFMSNSNPDGKNPLYELPAKTVLSGIKVNVLLLILLFVFLILLGGTAYALFDLSSLFFEGLWPMVISSITLIPVFFIIWIIRFYRKQKGRIPTSLQPAIDKLGSLSVGYFYNMIVYRVTSLISMTSEVFTKRIFRLVQKTSYMKSSWKGKIISNDIDDLNEQSSIEGETISPAMLTKFTIANTFPTTLWFTSNEKEKKKEEFEALKDVGECTTAYNLYQYIDKLPEELTSEINDVKKKLIQIWKDCNSTKKPSS